MAIFTHRQTDIVPSAQGLNARFGDAIALSGDTLVMGASKADSGGVTDAGAAYVFVRSGAAWVEQATLTASDKATLDRFGSSVAISGDTIAIGAPSAPWGSIDEAGAVYVFTRSGSTWSQQAKLTASDGAAGDKLGYSVAIENDTVVSGAPFVAGTDVDQGAVYIFTRSGSTWSQQAKLLYGSQGDNMFGVSVGISGETVIIGANGYDRTYVAQGVTYIYVRSGSTWNQQAELTITAPAFNDQFGRAVSIEGDTALIGCPNRETEAGTDAGAAYIFTRSGTTWSQRVQLIPDTGASGERFGDAVTLRDGYALVGVPLRGNSTGAAYRFKGSDATWTQDMCLGGQNASSGDEFGTGLALDGEWVFVSSPGWSSGRGRVCRFIPGPEASANPHDKFCLVNQGGSAAGRNPIAYADGEKREEVTDLTVNTPAGTLTFTRTYLQNTQNQYQFMGLGWLHNHRPILTLISGTPNQIVVYLPNGAEAHFEEIAPNHYEGTPGVTAVVDYDGGSQHYTLTALDTSAYVFDFQGKLLFRNFTNHDTWSYTYSGNNLTEVSDGYGRKLVFRYLTSGTFSGQLYRVGDHTFDDTNPTAPTGRYLEFGYVTNRIESGGSIVPGSLALLSTVRDVCGNTWSYDYYGQHLGETDIRQLNYLTQYTSPSVDTSGDGVADSSIILKHLTYTLIGSGANTRISQITQAMGDDALIETMTFQPTSDNRATQTVVNIDTAHFFDVGVYAGASDPNGNFSGQYQNAQYRPELQVDGKGNPTHMVWSEDGRQLHAVTDALSHQTSFVYNPSGASEGTLDYSLDPEGRKTQYLYDDSANPRLPTQIKVIEVDGSTVLRWQTFSYDSHGRTLTERTVAPTDGSTVQQETTRTYGTSGNGSGLLHTLTRKDLEQPANNTTTTYTYDAFGRVVKTQQSATLGSCTVSYTVLDAGGNAVATICNYDPGANPDPLTAAEAVALFDPAYPDKNRVTTHVYDSLNRRVQSTTDAGAAYALTTLTVYDSLNRVVRTIANYVPTPAVSDPYTHERRDFGHGDDNTQNQITETRYNERGLPCKQIDVLGPVTLLGYDLAGRLVRTVQSASQPDYDNSYALGGDPDLSRYARIASDAPDVDMLTETSYDAAGNVIRTIDTDGNVTLNGYDALNRVVRTIRNASQPDYDLAQDPLLAAYVPEDVPDQDLIQDTEYDALGRVRRVRDALGSWTLYGYDGLGRNVATVTYASQPDYDLGLDPSLAGYIARDGSDLDFISRTVYDPKGRVMMTEDPLGRRHWTGYDGLNRPIQTVVNASRGATDGGLNDPRSPVYSPDPTRSDQDRISRTEYNSDGRVVRTQDPLGHWTLWGYDDEGRQVRVIRNASSPGYNTSLDPALGHYSARPDAGTDEDLTTQTFYDAQGRVQATADAGGMTTHYEYDVLGRRTRVIVNRVTGVFTPLRPDQDLVSTTRYDLAGRVVETRDARGSCTQYGYDRTGRQVKVVEAAGSAVESVRYTCYDKGGRVLRVIANYRARRDDPSPDARDSQGNWLFSANQHGLANDQNLTTTFTYDRAGRQVAVTNAAGDSTQSAYFRDGATASITDALGMVTAYRYDRARRRVLTVVNWVSGVFTDPATWDWDEAQSRWEDGTGTPIAFGTGDDQNILIQVTYDKAGRMTSRRDPRGALTSYQYDQLDRRIMLTDALAQTWENRFEEGNGVSQTTQVNPLGQAARHTSDQAGRVKRVEYLDESPKLTPDVFFEYDRGGNRVRMSEYEGATPVRTTVFGHDRRYRLTQVSFDDNGDGIPEQALTYAYDPEGQRTALSLPDGKTVTYSYDPRGRLLQLKDWGGGVTAYRYDGAGRLVAEMRPNGLLTRRLYDPAGRLQLLRHSLGKTLRGSFEYRVDGRGNRIEAVEAVPTALVGGTSYGYSHPAITCRGGTWVDNPPYRMSSDLGASLRLAFGGMSASLTLGTASDGGLVDVYLDGVLYTRLDGYSLTPGETTLSLVLSGEGLHQLEIRGHADKNLASTGYALRFKELVTDPNSPQFEIQTLRYEYDGLSRLVDARYYPGVNTGVAESLLPRRYQYIYDPGGNRTRETVSLAGVPATTLFTYNALNQITSGGVAYDTAGRMTSNGTNSYNWDRADRLLSMGGVSYAYDGLGNRIRQTVSSVVTRYLNDLQPGLVKVLNSESNGATTRYLHDISGIHSQQTPGGDWVFPIMDALGSLRGVVNPTGEVLEGQDYAPYGTPFEQTGTAQTPFGFTGEVTDASGLVYLRARYYLPALGVFPSLDPVEEGNRYGYVGGNVVNRVDPSGMFPDLGDVEKGDAGFSCNCGWLDWKHIRKTNQIVYDLLDDLRFASSQTITNPFWTGLWGVYTYVPLGLGILEVHLFGGVAAIPDRSAKAVIPLAVSIFMSANERFEENQLRASQEWFPGTVPPFKGRLTSSYFSEEDLPSDLIGFYIAHQRWSGGQKSSSVVEEQVKKICGAVGREESLEVFKQIYGEGALGITGWRNWVPRLMPLSGCCADLCTGLRVWPVTFSNLTSQRVLPQLYGDWWWLAQQDITQLGPLERTMRPNVVLLNKRPELPQPPSKP